MGPDGIGNKGHELRLKPALNLLPRMVRHWQMEEVSGIRCQDRAWEQQSSLPTDQPRCVIMNKNLSEKVGFLVSDRMDTEVAVGIQQMAEHLPTMKLPPKTPMLGGQGQILRHTPGFEVPLDRHPGKNQPDNNPDAFEQ